MPGFPLRKRREYQATYRSKHFDYVLRNANLNKARERAKSRLARQLPELFKALFEEEKAKLGVGECLQTFDPDIG